MKTLDFYRLDQYIKKEDNEDNFDYFSETASIEHFNSTVHRSDEDEDIDINEYVTDWQID